MPASRADGKDRPPCRASPASVSGAGVATGAGGSFAAWFQYANGAVAVGAVLSDGFRCLRSERATSRAAPRAFQRLDAANHVDDFADSCRCSLAAQHELRLLPNREATESKLQGPQGHCRPSQLKPGQRSWVHDLEQLARELLKVQAARGDGQNYSYALQLLAAGIHSGYEALMKR